ncbi:MAG: hypothetical protein DHS20C21_02690 [Gemmatimonadota bacterium]|nr:MAG: hypothetical protein DHS20C21_02690 [Gemmatimonadota bacterium]
MQGLLRRVLRVLPFVYIVSGAFGPASAAPRPAVSPDPATPAPAAPEPERRLPAQLVDLDGVALDVAEMAREDNLVLVTLKRPDCPVCLEQLVRLRERLPELEACGVRFLVLSPGPVESLRRARKASGFPYPFVADPELRIAESLGLARPGGEIFPCLLQVLPDLGIGWRQLGRNGAYFGDGPLQDFFDCSRAV